MAGDFVGITGTSANPWRLVPNSGQTISTTGLSGNVAPGTSWTPRMAPRQWHWVASNAGGDVLVAADIPGTLNVSVDGGATFTAGDSPTSNWISTDMTPSASRIMAVAYGGGMFTSTNRGVNWTPVASGLAGQSFSGREWESVTISHDGLRIAANVMNGPVYLSSDGGTTWSVATSASPAFANNTWRAIDSSADGSVIVAAAQGGTAFISTGTTGVFTPLNVVVGGTPVTDGWYRIAISHDGNTIALAGNTQFAGASTGLYISRDRGATWTRGSTAAGEFTALAVSADGSVIGATMSGGGGQVLLSTNGGTSFAPLTMPGTDTNWRAFAMSADGNAFAVAAGSFTGMTGQLYTSVGNRTSVGSLGFIGGGQNGNVEVEFVSNGRWTVRSSSGGPFTVR